MARLARIAHAGGLMRWSTFGLVATGTAGLVLVADEALKSFVRTRLGVCDPQQFSTCASLDLVASLRLVRTENAGSALGFGQGLGVWLVLATIGLGCIALYAHNVRAFGGPAALAVGLQSGGGFGNLLDRVATGGATDMLTLGQSGLVWNVADLALVSGTLIATFVVLRRALLPRGLGVRSNLN